MVDGFNRNPSGQRSLRLGVDAGAWLGHASYTTSLADAQKNAEPTRGDDAVLEKLFFGLCQLAKFPVSVVFMIDLKNGVNREGLLGDRSAYRRAQGFKELVCLFGWDWREVSPLTVIRGENSFTT